MEDILIEDNGNGDKSRDSYCESSPQLSFFRQLFWQSTNRFKQAKEGKEQTLHETKTRVENNIEALDYLRGISCLERDFVNLAEKVIKVSLQLSHDCKDINREAFSSTEIAQEVDKSWQHINHLGSILQTHVKHAKRYHLFNLEAENLELRLKEIDSNVENLITRQTPTETAVNNISSEIHRILESLIEAFVNWQKLNQQISIVYPLHRRMPLPSGIHSGVLLISITLPSTNTKAGSVLRAGTRVHVRASRSADVLHREWFLVDPTREEEQGGLVISSVPAAFVWLDSTDQPSNGTGIGGAAPGKCSSRYPITSMSRTQGNAEIVENLRKYLFRVWEKSCSKFDHILRKMGTTLLEKALADSQLKPLGVEEQKRLDGALQKMTELTKITSFQPKDETEGLEQLIDTIKFKRDEQGEYANVDLGAADALLQAIDIFEELVACNESYGSLKVPDAILMDESEKNWQDTCDKLDTTSRDSMESFQPAITPIPYQSVAYADPVVSNATCKSNLKSPDLKKFSKPIRHNHRHWSLTNDGFDADDLCLYSTDSSAGNVNRSVSLVSQSVKGETLSDANRPPSRGRRRDRLYRFLPILLRRHTQSKKASKMSDDGESGFSDNEVSRVGRCIPSNSPKAVTNTYESLTLGRMNYLKKSDLHKLNRAPLFLSTSMNEDLTPTRTSTLRRYEPHRDYESPLSPRIFYSTACQNGICVSSMVTKIEQPLSQKLTARRFGKKMQVGMSFIADPNIVDAKLSPEMIEREDCNPNIHVYANIDPTRAYSLNQSVSNVLLYDMGIQVDLPNRLRGLRCRLEFEQPGVELGDKDNLACEAYNERFDEENAEYAQGEEAGEEDRDYKTLSFRVAFNNKSTSCASTI